MADWDEAVNDKSKLRKPLMGIPSIPPPVNNPGVDLPPIGGQMKTDMGELQRLSNSKSGIDQIKNPIGHGILKTLDVIGSALMPRVAAAIPGTMLHHDKLVNQARQATTSDLGMQQEQAQTGNIESETALHEAQTEKLKQPPKDPLDEPLSIVESQSLSVPFGTTKRQAQGKTVPQKADNNVTAYEDFRKGYPATPEGQAKSAKDWQKMNKVDLHVPGQPKENEMDKMIPPETLAQLNSSQDGLNLPVGTTWRQAAEKGIVPKSKKEIQMNNLNLTKVEDRKALADNVESNIQVMRGIMGRRPDLFGPGAGRWTSIKETFGTGDPDILAWEQAKNNVIKANVGMHNMRSKYALESDKLLYDFKHQPEAIEGSLQSMSHSAQQFINEAVGNRTGEPGEVIPEYVRDANGKLVLKK